ncbi:MAG: PTS sugar transporter subunit IIA [Candidatus Omnitrophota bacterium]|nr:PTS sugar transporter subunit IIA [Candidatus Omnitrophota bacterium]
MFTARNSEIKLSNFLKEKYICLELKGKNKKEIIVELVGLIAASGKLKDKRLFVNNILKREKLGSTGIGNGVGIPHSKSKKVNDFILAFGRKNSGIDFGALDGEKTYIFFMLASPEKNIGGHLKLLSEISRMVRDKFISDRLKSANSKKEILKIISLG